MKVHYLRHPYLIWRTLIRPLEEWDSKRYHSSRVQEYQSCCFSLPQAANALLGVSCTRLAEETQSLKKSGFADQIRVCLDEAGACGGSMVGNLGLFLYMTVSALRPEVVIETGVANGFSSSFILKALRENGSGKLYSIDLDYREGVAVPPGRRLGWVIPQDIRDKWRLLLGESTKVLPKILKNLGHVDLFLHDSRHLYKTMMREYSIVWPYLAKDGLLISDDATENDAFLDFAEKVGERFYVIGRLGVIRKGSGHV